MFQGRTAGANMAGDELEYGALTAYSITCFDLPIAFVGPVDIPAADRAVRVTDDGVLQLFLRGNRAYGATCVGPFTERAAVSKLIGAKKTLNEAEISALKDPRTPIASVVA
jgi:hypothetical protein